MNYDIILLLQLSLYSLLSEYINISTETKLKGALNEDFNDSFKGNKILGC